VPFKLLDTNRYWLPGLEKRALHIASLSDGLHEYMCFSVSGKIYIEEITGGHLEFIDDDSLAAALSDFLTHNKVLDSSRPLLPDDYWYNLGK